MAAYVALDSAYRNDQLLGVSAGFSQNPAAARAVTFSHCSAAASPPVQQGATARAGSASEQTAFHIANGKGNGSSACDDALHGLAASAQRDDSAQDAYHGEPSSLASGPASQRTAEIPLSTCGHIRHFCHRCDAEFNTHQNWDRHVKEVCETCKKYRCPHSSCAEVFPRLDKLREHDRTQHHANSGTCQRAHRVQAKAVKQHQALGCGFCNEVFAELVPFMKHFCKHLKEGKTKDNWDSVGVIDSLLRQSGVAGKWTALCSDLRSLYSNADLVPEYLDFCTQSGHQGNTFIECLEGGRSYATPVYPDLAQKAHARSLRLALETLFFEFVATKPIGADEPVVIGLTSQFQVHSAETAPESNESLVMASTSIMEEPEELGPDGSATQSLPQVETDYHVPTRTSMWSNPYPSLNQPQDLQNETAQYEAAGGADFGFDYTPGPWQPDSATWPLPEADDGCIDPRLLLTMPEGSGDRYGGPGAANTAILASVGTQDGQQLSEDGMRAGIEQFLNDSGFDALQHN